MDTFVEDVDPDPLKAKIIRQFKEAEYFKIKISLFKTESELFIAESERIIEEIRFFKKETL